jgi:TonB family protein
LACPARPTWFDSARVLRRPRALLLLVAVLVASGACRSGERVDPADMYVTPVAARGATCSPEAFPATLPGADVVVDSVALVRRVGELLAGDAARAGWVRFSLSFDDTGHVLRRDVLEYTTTSAVADSVWHLAFDIVRDVDPSQREWGVRLRVDVADPVALEVERRQFCPPTARSPEMQAAMRSYSPPGVRVRGGMRERTLRVHAQVDQFGAVTAARIVGSQYAGSSLERDVVLYLRRFQFNPATVDGDAAAAWIEVPVRVRLPQ